MSDIKKDEGKEVLLLFSGGYDSVAVLHYLITKEKHSKITLLYEKSPNMQDDYGYKLAKKIYNIFNKKYDVDLIWLEEKISLDWVGSNKNGRDILLNLHLNSFIRHGNFENYYIGWNKSNIKKIPLSKRTLDFFNSNKREGIKINFLEDVFYGENEYLTKEKVIEYLLDNKIFHLPHTCFPFESEKEFKKREVWYKNTSKEREVLRALLEIEMFDAKDLSNILLCKNTKDVQKIYNECKKKELNKENGEDLNE
jgi:hypothetical protein